MLLCEIAPLYEWINDKNYLYHGTNAQAALQIIRSGHIKDFTQSRIDNTKTGVSLTRNPRYAETGSDDAGRRSSKVGGNTIDTEVIFVFDGEILNNIKKKYTVAQSMGKSSDDSMTKGTAQTEYEEFVHGTLPLDKKYGYIGFYLNNLNMDHALKYTFAKLPGYMFRSPMQTSKNIAMDNFKKKQAQSVQANAHQNMQPPKHFEPADVKSDRITPAQTTPEKTHAPVDYFYDDMKRAQVARTQPLKKQSLFQRLMGW